MHDPVLLDEQRESLITRLKAAGVPNVWEQVVPSGVELPRQNGVVLPYVLIGFGGQAPVAMRNQGITSSRDDLKVTSVSIEAVGASPGDARKVEGIVRGQLEGYDVGPGWGELREQLSDSYTVRVPDSQLFPVRFVRAAVWNAFIGA